jgi:WD40 repeat protein
MQPMHAHLVCGALLVSLLVGCGRGISLRPGAHRDTGTPEGGTSPTVDASADEVGLDDGAADGGPLNFRACGAWGGTGLRALAAPTVGSVLATGWDDGSVLVFDGDLHVRRTIAAHQSAVTALGFSADQATLATASGGEVKVWKALDGTLVRAWPARTGPIAILDLSPNADLVLTVGGMGVAEVSSVADGKTLWTGPSDDHEVHGAFFTADESAVFLVGGKVQLKRASDGMLLREGSGRYDIGNQQERPLFSAWPVGSSDPRGQFVGVLSGAEQLLIGRTDDFSVVRMLATDSDSDVSSGGFGHVGFFVVAGTRRTPETAFLDVYRAEDWSRVQSRTLDYRPALTAFPEDGPVLADSGGRLTAYDPETGLVRTSFDPGRGQSDDLRELHLSGDGTLEVEHGYDAATVRHALDGSYLYTVTGLSPSASAIAFSPDSSNLAVIGSDGRVRVLRASDGRELRSFGQGAGCVAFSPAGDDLYVCAGTTVARYRFADGSASGVSEPLGLGAVAIAVSPDGGSVAVKGTHDAYSLATLEAANLHVKWTNDDDWLSDREGASLEFSRDGAILAVKSADSFAVPHFYATSSGAPVDMPSLLEAQNGTLSFSRDGSLLAVGGASEVTLVATSGWRVLARIPGANHLPRFSPNDDRLFLGGPAGHTQVYCDVTAGTLSRPPLAR